MDFGERFESLKQFEIKIDCFISMSTVAKSQCFYEKLRFLTAHGIYEFSPLSKHYCMSSSNQFW